MDTNLEAVLLRYEEYLNATLPAKKAQNRFNQTKSATTRYLLTGMGYLPPQGRKPTKLETASTKQVLQNITLEQLKNALTYLEEGFVRLQANDVQRHTNRSRIKALLEWAEQENLLPRSGKQEISLRCPPIQRGYGSESTKRLRDDKKPNYGLKAVKPEEVKRAKEIQSDCLSSDKDKQWAKEIELRLTLDAQIDLFYKFLTQENFPYRKEDLALPSTGESYVKRLYTFLGWLHNIEGSAFEQLANNFLTPYTNLLSKDESDHKFAKAVRKAAKKKAKEEGDYIGETIARYLEFLEKVRECRSPHTLQNYLSCVEKVLYFRYHRLAKDKNYSNIPAIQVIREYSRAISKKEATHDGVSDLTLKWLDLPDVLERVVNPLRRECECKLANRSLRSFIAIASSFQLYLVWALLTYMPPRRQQEFRELKIATSCLLTDKPKNLALDQFIHPLPPQQDRNNHTEKYFPYLYKESGIWRVDHTRFSYKTGKTYKEQSLEIPNQKFSDGKDFYVYLEAFLYGYYRNSKGNWCSSSEVIAPLSANWKLHSLRMNFCPQQELEDKGSHRLAKPQHVFIGSKSGKKFCDTSFGSLMSRAAHRLTGQRLTPHLLRDIYATWFLDQDFTAQQITSLAYAMGHSEAMLRKKYDKRKEGQRRRLAQEAVAKIVADHVK